jgi:hypothetical protein
MIDSIGGKTMKNKFLFSAMFLLLLVGFYVPASYSQDPTYTLTLANDTKTAPNVYEFDVYVLNTSTNPFHYFGIQCKLGITTATLNGGTLTATWVAGSNDPVLVAADEVNTLFVAPLYVRIIVPLNAGTFATTAIISDVAPGTILGRLRLTNSVNFGGTGLLNVTWLYTTPFPTKVYAYNDDGSGISDDITVNDASHQLFSNWSNPLLPVELTSFVSNVSGRQVNLSWETKTEVNSSKYEIERALTTTKDATVTWSSVGNVQAAGNSNSPKKYSYTDKNLQAGKYQYRLKMVDNDGSFSYSSVEAAEVAVPKDFAVSQNYPNPFNPSTKIDYQVPVDAKVIMEVYNIAGQKVMELVNQQMSAGYYTVDFGASKLSSGVYVYRLAASDKATGNNFSSIKKMMLIK